MADQGLLCDRYRPTELAKITYNRRLVDRLNGLSNCLEIPHIILQGAPGCGKKTLALAFLNEKFGSGVQQMTNHSIEVNCPSKQINVNIVQSKCHYQINPSLYGVYDRSIIQDFLKNLVKFQLVNRSQIPYRTIIIEQADKLTHEAQQSLRRTLEKYIGVFRCIFICTHFGNLIPALQSRCIIMRVASPKPMETQAILARILRKEKIELPEHLMKVIIKNHRGHLTQAICDLENLIQLYEQRAEASTGTVKTAGSGEEHAGRSFDWPEKLKYSEISHLEKTTESIVKLIFQSNDLMVVQKIRDYFYELLIHGLEPTEILKSVFRLIFRQIPDTEPGVQTQIFKTTADHQDQLEKGSKPIYHLESYVVHLLIIIKKWVKSKNQRSEGKSLPKPNPKVFSKPPKKKFPMSLK